MKTERIGVTLATVFGLTLLHACGGDQASSGPPGEVAKGGDDKTGGYDFVADWWS